MKRLLPLFFSPLLFLVSCTPMMPSEGGDRGGSQSQPLPRLQVPPSAGGQTTRAPSLQEQRKIRELQDAQRNGQGGELGRSVPPPPRSPLQTGTPSPQPRQGTLDSPDDLMPPIDIRYRYAMPVPGRKGWVLNPWTHRPVDARSVASGALIYDETDPANQNPDGTLMPVSRMPHKFRVP